MRSQRREGRMRQRRGKKRLKTMKKQRRRERGEEVNLFRNERDKNRPDRQAREGGIIRKKWGLSENDEREIRERKETRDRIKRGEGEQRA